MSLTLSPRCATTLWIVASCALATAACEETTPTDPRRGIPDDVHLAGGPSTDIAADAPEAPTTCEQTGCGEFGTCVQQGGVHGCVCAPGYSGLACEDCLTGFHRNDVGQCVPDQACLPSTCSGRGTCQASSGVVSCVCNPGHAPPWCQSCLDGFHVAP